MDSTYKLSIKTNPSFIQEMVSFFFDRTTWSMEVLGGSLLKPDEFSFV